MIEELLLGFIQNYLGSIVIAGVLLVVLLGFLMLYFQIPPQFVILLLLPLIGTLTIAGFGLPSWVLILGLVFAGIVVTLFFYSRVL